MGTLLRLSFLVVVAVPFLASAVPISFTIDGKGPFTLGGVKYVRYSIRGTYDSASVEKVGVPYSVDLTHPILTLYVERGQTEDVVINDTLSVNYNALSDTPWLTLEDESTRKSRSDGGSVLAFAVSKPPKPYNLTTAAKFYCDFGQSGGASVSTPKGDLQFSLSGKVGNAKVTFVVTPPNTVKKSKHPA